MDPQERIRELERERDELRARVEALEAKAKDVVRHWENGALEVKWPTSGAVSSDHPPHADLVSLAAILWPQSTHRTRELLPSHPGVVANAPDGSGATPIDTARQQEDEPPDPDGGMVAWHGTQSCGCPAELRDRGLHMSRCEVPRQQEDDPDA